MKKLNIGITAFGSNIRGISEEEMSHSNAAIIEARLFRKIYETYDVTFHLLKSCNGSTADIITKGAESGDDFFSRFKFCSETGEYPENLDLIYTQMGSDNLRQVGRFRGIHLPNPTSYFSTIEKYPNTQILYIQTDFACPIFLGESYGKVDFFSKMFPMSRLFKNRKIHTLSFGSPQTEEAKKFIKLDFNYCNERFNKLYFINPDFQSIIDTSVIENKTNFEVVGEPTRIAFAGKNRIKGSRDGFIREIFFNNDIDCYIMGNWSNNQDYVKENENNPHFNISDGYVKYLDMLEEYNKSGFTFYVTCHEYQNMSTVTSRFYDALTAKALPLIYYRDKETCERIFGKELIEDLVVTKENIKDVMAKFSTKESRENKINALKAKYLENREIVTNEFTRIFEEILSYQMPEEEKTLDSLVQAFKDGTNERQKYKSRFRMKPEQVEEHVEWFMENLKHEERLSFDEFKELANGKIWDFKIAVAKNGAYPNREVQDIPEEELFKLYSTIYI